MKLTLEFTLPDEATEARLAQQGSDWRLVVWSTVEWLREQMDKEKDATARFCALYECMSQINDKMQTYGLQLEG